MLHVAVAQSECVSTSCAVNDVVISCARQLGSARPTAGLVFAGREFDHAEMLDDIRKRFGPIPLVGCSTSGELSSDFGFSDDSICLVLFSSDTIRMHAVVAKDLSHDHEASLARAIEQARTTLGQDPRLCLAFPDSLSTAPAEVATTLGRLLGPTCPVFGANAARQWFHTESAVQFFNGQVLYDAAPLLFLAGPVRYAYTLSNSWRPVGRPAVVTEAEGPLVKRIGEQTALDFYQHYLGTHSTPAFELPLAVYDDEGQHFYIRSPSSYDPVDGSVRFPAVIPEGATIQLTEATRERIIEDTTASLRSLVGQLDNDFVPAVALIFSCSVRKQILGTRSAEELSILRQELPTGTPIAGLFAFGEICPMQSGRASIQHNCTMVTLLLAESDATCCPAPCLSEVGRGKTAPSFLHPGALERELLMLRKKLQRCQTYRQRLEVHKDQTSELMRTINVEINAARAAIQSKNELLRQALALAEEVQQNLLPKDPPSLKGFDLAVQSIYCDETGGDYYDFLELPHDGGKRRVLLVVGDVTGHGIAAALLMATARATLRTLAGLVHDPALLMERLNRQLTRDAYDTGRFMTMLTFVLEEGSHEVGWLRAGHDPGYVYDPETGSFQELLGQGSALGLSEDSVYTMSVHAGLRPGQVLLAGTDGIWEQRSPAGEMFGKERFMELVREMAHGSAAEIVDGILEAVQEYRGGLDPEDDLTLAVAKVLEA